MRQFQQKLLLKVMMEALSEFGLKIVPLDNPSVSEYKENTLFVWKIPFQSVINRYFSIY